MALVTDYLVLGSGVAGLSFALTAARHGEVTIVTKRERDDSATQWAQGGVAAVLSPDERPVAKWNSNPYRPDGGSGGAGEDDGAYFLLPYWMGRFHGWVE